MIASPSQSASERVGSPAVPLSLTPAQVRAAVLAGGGVAQGARALGCSRAHLYKAPELREAVDAAMREIAARPVVATTKKEVRLPPDLVERLDKLAEDRELDRSALVAEALATLPKRLPAPARSSGGDGGQQVTLTLPAAAVERLWATGDGPGVLRALLAKYASR